MSFYGKIQGKCAAEELPHTRWADCDTKEALTKAIFITSSKFTFPISSAEMMMQALKQGVLSGQVFPIYGVNGQPRTGGEAATASTSHGPSIYVGKTATSVTYEFSTLGACASTQLAYFSLKNMRVLRLDINDMLWGHAVSDTVGRGFAAQLLHRKAEPTTETETYMNYIDAAYTSNYAKEERQPFAWEVTSEITGLTGITLKPGAAVGQANIVEVCSGTDVGVEIAAMLESSSVVDILATDAGVHPTSGTIDPDTGLITGLSPSAAYHIVGAAALDGLGVVGFDGSKQSVQLTGNPDA